MLSLIFFPGWSVPHAFYQPLLNALERLKIRTTLLPLPTDARIGSAIAALDFEARPPLHFCGHSLGGGWAMAAAERWERAKVFCLASTPRFVAEHNWPGLEAAEVDKLSEQITGQPERAVKAFHRRICQGSPDRIEPPVSIDGIELRLSLYPLYKLDNRSFLESQGHRCLFYLGDNDALLPGGLAQAMATRFPQVYIWKHSLGHMAGLGQPQSIARLIRRWLDG